MVNFRKKTYNQIFKRELNTYYNPLKIVELVVLYIGVYNIV